MSRIRINATRAASRKIRERGGRLFVWFEPVSRRSPWTVQRVDTAPPAGGRVEFREHQAAEFTLYLPRDYNPPPPRELTIRLTPLFRRLAVSGTGAGAAEGPWSGGGGAGASADHGNGGNGGGGGGNGGA